MAQTASWTQFADSASRNTFFDNHNNHRLLIPSSDDIDKAGRQQQRLATNMNLLHLTPPTPMLHPLRDGDLTRVSSFRLGG